MVEQKQLVKAIELTLVTPAGEAHRVLMKQSPFTIGRHESCDLVLNSRSVSRLHCQLKLKSFGLTVKDLESRNGTYLDSELIATKTRVPLKQDSLLRIGKFQLKIDRIFQELEVSEDNSLLEPSEIPFGSSAGTVEEEPEQLLAELEQFIVRAHRKRCPQPQPAQGDSASTPNNEPSESLSTSGKNAASGQAGSAPDADTKFHERHETTLHLTKSAGSSAQGTHSHSAFESGDTEPDENEIQRRKLREQLDAMKPRDSKEAAIQALRNLFGQR